MANDRAAANLIQQVTLGPNHGGNVAHLGGLEMVPLQGSFQEKTAVVKELAERLGLSALASGVAAFNIQAPSCSGRITAIYGGKDTDLCKYLGIDVPMLLAALPACKAAVNEARSPRWRFLPPADLPISMAALKLDLDAEALQAACDAGDALRQFMEHLDPTQADSTFDALDDMQEVLAAEAAAERRAREQLGQWTGVLRERFAELQQQHQRSVTGVDHKFTEILQRVDSLRGAGSDRVAALSAKVTDLAAAMAELKRERTRLKLTKCR
ncbi:hypothetical protein ACK3TF_003821 [Chlorella vulgaris]